MGSGAIFKCPKCKFKFETHEGIGMMFPSYYQDTVAKAKEGKLGPELKTFFAEHPEGAINAENRTYCCEECGSLSNETDLTMYLPDESKRGNPSEEYDYVMEADLEDFYIEYAKYPHKCRKCGGKMRLIDYGDDILCPKCHVPLEGDGFIMWD